MDRGLGDHDGNVALIKKEVNKIKKEIASTIYCSAMIGEMGRHEEVDQDFLHDCSYLSEALTKIYVMRFRTDPLQEVEGIIHEGGAICSTTDIGVVADTLEGIATKSTSQVVSAIFKSCSIMARAISDRMKRSDWF